MYLRIRVSSTPLRVSANVYKYINIRRCIYTYARFHIARSIPQSHVDDLGRTVHELPSGALPGASLGAPGSPAAGCGCFDEVLGHAPHSCPSPKNYKGFENNF